MIDIIVPLEQEGTRAVVRSWLKQVGERVEENEPLVELETDKVAVEVPAPASGVLREIVLASDAQAEPGAVLGRIAAVVELDAGEPELAPTPVRVERSRDTDVNERDNRSDRGFSTSLEANGTGTHEHRLSPSVRRAVRQHGIDPARIEGTGRNGRITRADVDKAIEQGIHTEGVLPALTSQAIPHDRMRLRIAENMLHSVTIAPHVTAVFEADFGAIIAHRARHKDAFAARGAKLTYTAYLVAAAAEAMKAAPAINSRWHEDRLEIFGDVNIGVGTALGDKGLIVPVLQGAQALSLEETAKGLDALIEKARAEKLTSPDVRGGTFTISNHGVSGSLFATPIIINQPQSAILGVGKLEKRVVVREVDGADAILIRPIAYVSLTIDHRVVDGHQTNAWLSRFVEVLENWPLD